MKDSPKEITQSLNLNLWFIRLRWIACIVSFTLVTLTIKVFHYLEEHTFWPLISLIGLLALTNLVYTFFVKQALFVSRLKEMQIISDLFILTLMLHYSGGIENPLSFVYLFHVILSGILLNKRKCYAVVGLSFFLYTTLALSELSGIVPHYTLQIFPHSEIEHHVNDSSIPPENSATPPPDSSGEEILSKHASHYPLYVGSMSFLSLFIMILTAYFITNIMERLRAEEKRTREEHQRLEQVLNAIGAGLLILDNHLKPIWYNEPVKGWLGLDTGNSDQQVGADSNWIEGNDEIAALTLRDGSIHSIERERVDAANQKQYFQVTAAPLTDAEGEVYQVVELIQDISEKKVLERQVIHAAKMATMGTVTAGIAHEVGNPLASISTRLHLLESDHNQAFVTQSVRLLQREIDRIERIVRGISQFGRPSNKRWGLCAVNPIILEIVEMLKYYEASKRCQIKTELAKNLPDTLGVRDQLKQIFLNLGLNALEAIPEASEGTLTIKSYAVKGSLKVEFTDTGAGIDKSVQEKIFQPFFTTKEKGSGLGLFIVNHIVQAHGGQVILESEAGKGTRFVVKLPIPRRPSK